MIDYVGGWEDIHNHVIRTIGQPEVRFKQDPVRMIRLLKFQARFGFKSTEETHQALLHSRHEIVKSSPARVLEEMLRMLESCSSAPFFKRLHEAHILELLFPSLAKVFHTPKGEEILRFLNTADHINRRSPKFPIERAVLVSCILFPLLEEELHRLYLSKGLTPHLGEILTTISDLQRNYILSSFSHFPRRISAIMAYVLSTQYRLIPLKSKKVHLQRLFRTKEFPLALRLLKIRASIQPELQSQYIHIRESFRHFIRNEEKRSRHTERSRDLRARDSHAVSR
ncbi:Poly(A) polymerase I [Chlamydiales bacterium STE3]|nr:Poly(A) polymerase I [Chlamydiales bacterium STE3]